MKTILVAEDDQADALLLERAFRRLHFAYRLANIRDGREVVDYLGGHGIYADRSEYPYPALIILDWKLPSKSGAEILEWIREKKGLPPLFVVILTGAIPDGAPRETFQQFGNVQVFSCHFLKPLSDTNLQIVMRIFETWQKGLN